MQTEYTATARRHPGTNRRPTNEREPAYKDYYKYLRDILSQNPESGPNNPDDSNLYLIHWYRPGDYSRAALAALKQEAK